MASNSPPAIATAARGLVTAASRPQRAVGAATVALLVTVHAESEPPDQARAD